ncbi:MAG: DUF2752 domain-containing protein [Bacteroidetes bacterium]|nr:DUF2752 domain-containing protein [Bacteroidota bacterium]
MLQCPSKKYLGIECFGCGLQRSFILLLKGNFVDSLKMYPATLPILFVFCYTILHLKFKFNNGAKVIQYSFVSTSAIIVIFYIYKIFTHKIF